MDNVPNQWFSVCPPRAVVPVAPAANVDAFGRLRVSQPFTLFDSQQRYALDRSFVSNTASGGNITYVSTQSTANLQVNSTLGSFAARETKYTFTYQPGKSLLFLASFVMAPASDGNLRQRVGYFGRDNGIYLELLDQLYIVQRSNVTSTVVNTRIAQSEWNVDPLNGLGPSGIVLDITRAQIFWTDIEWLGVGNVRVGFVLDGQFVTCHVFRHANSVRTTYITTANLPVRYEIERLKVDGPVTSNLLQICSTVISEGGYDQPYMLQSNLATFSSTMTAGVWYPVLSLRLSPDYLEAFASIRQIDVALTSTNTIQWALWSNVAASNLTGGTFAQHAMSLFVQVNQRATALTVTGCYQVAAGIITSTNQSSANEALQLDKYYSQIGRDSMTRTSEIMTLAVYSPVTISGNPVTLQALLSWNELL